MLHSKYFLALVIPQPYQEQLTTLKEYISLNFNSRGALRSSAHITLHMPFEWKEDKERRLIEVLHGFSFPEVIQIKLKDFSCFEPRVLFVDVVKNELLNELQKKLVKHCMQNLQLFNEAENKRGFHPHVTVAFRDLKKEAFYRAWDYYKVQTYSAEFTMSCFHVLKHDGNKWNELQQINWIVS